MDLGGSIRAFHFDSLQRRDRWRRGLSSHAFLPPIPGDCSQEQQQGKAEETHEASRQTAGLFDAPQAVDVASGSVGTGVQVELLNQAILVQPQQLGIGTNVTAGEGMPRQLAEIAGLDASQRALGEIQLLCNCRQRPALVFASYTQRLAGVVAHRCSGFLVRRGHRCSERYCLYSSVPGYSRLSCSARLAAVSRS